MDTSMLGFTVDLRSIALGERTYRAFRLDKRGRVASAEIIAADNDEQARGIAETLASEHGLELWERKRRLARYPQWAAVVQ